MEGSRVLVIDDDATIRLLVRRLCEHAGAHVTEASGGQEGLRALYDERPHIVVLDVVMPELDGWQTLERIRQITDVPVVMLSARADELEKVRALQAGADDYVTKPFGTQELLARLQAHVRRAAAAGRTGEQEPERRYSDGAVSVDFEHAEATVEGKGLLLTPQEFRLLSAFVRHPRRTLSPEQLLSLAWDDPSGDARRVKVYVGYLRNKLTEAGLDPPPIETVRGFGYRYQPPSPV